MEDTNDKKNIKKNLFVFKLGTSLFFFAFQVSCLLVADGLICTPEQYLT